MIAIPPKQKKYQNIIMPFAKYESDTRTIASMIAFYKSVSPDKVLRDASIRNVDEFNQKANLLTKNKEFYQCMNDYKA